MTIRHAIALTCLATLVQSRAFSQQEVDLLYAGKPLFELILTFNVDYKPVKVGEQIKNEILDDKLLAIIIPSGAHKPGFKIRFVLKESLRDIPVAAEDLAALREFRKNAIAEKVRKVAMLSHSGEISSQAGRDTLAQLTRLVDENKGSNQFVGGILLNEGIQDNELLGYINAYKKSVNKSIDTNIDTIKAKPGLAYYHGSSSVTRVQLAGVANDSVERVKINDGIYYRTWVGATCVIIKPKNSDLILPVKGKSFNDISPLLLNETTDREIQSGFKSPSHKLEQLPLLKK